MPTRRRTLAIGLAGLAAAPGCGRRAIGETLPAPALRRGVNVHHMLNWPAHRDGLRLAEYVWPPFETAPYRLADETLGEIAARGFTFVRLTVDPSIFLASSAPRRAELCRIVMSRVDRFLAAGLEVVVDLHPVEENPAYPPERLTDETAPEAEAYAHLVQDLARSLAQRPAERVALELMNEPHPPDPGGGLRWQRQQARLYAAARRVAPGLALVLSGADWSSAEELTRLDLTPYRGGNVIFTFHYYNPRVIALAGMPDAIPERYVSGLAWPADPGQAAEVQQATLARIAADWTLSREQRARAAGSAREALNTYFAERDGAARIAREFGALADWARAQGVATNRLLVGEFGAYHLRNETPAARAARLAWLASVRSAAERHGFGWAIWVLLDGSNPYGDIGILAPGATTGIDPGVIRALGLRPA